MAISFYIYLICLPEALLCASTGGARGCLSGVLNRGWCGIPHQGLWKCLGVFLIVKMIEGRVLLI